MLTVNELWGGHCRRARCTTSCQKLDPVSERNVQMEDREIKMSNGWRMWRSAQTTGLVILAGVALVACAENVVGPTGDAQLTSFDGVTTVSTAQGTLRLRCEKRSARSKISVDGNNLAPGTYSARVTSGGASVMANAQATIGDEVEFDFDSDPGDIAAGATAIAADFIDASASPAVMAEILDANGSAVVSASGDCATNARGGNDDEVDDRGDDDDGDDSADDDGDDDRDRGETTVTGSDGTLRLRCEVRTARGRSKISVDGKNLVPGMYSANVTSGGSSASAGPLSTIGDEVEFDFDSDPGDIAEGATAIAGNFIDTSSSPHVQAELLAADGTVVVSAGGDCEVRND